MSEIKPPPASTLDPTLKSMLEINATDDKNFIFCGTCSHVITRGSEKIQVNGQHEHFCINPHDLAFHVGCFANALGCDISGNAEAADSWFMGYFWRIATCAECNSHLGWYFSLASGEDHFYGLILDRVQEEP
ncbi:MAG: hypothetical protein GXP16_04000 [Gammaproteobacteria bacterium]|nr:hypothetical protein [Gammaproteobacteria bacterium]